MNIKYELQNKIDAGNKDSKPTCETDKLSLNKSFRVNKFVNRSNNNERRGTKKRNLFAVTAYNRRKHERRCSVRKKIA